VGAAAATALLISAPTALASAAPGPGPAHRGRPHAATVLYVAPTGAGAQCSRIAPCSLTKAQTLVRSKAPRMSADIDVDLLGGTYRLADTFQLGPRTPARTATTSTTRPTRASSR
jgi:hypothetical protein